MWNVIKKTIIGLFIVIVLVVAVAGIYVYSAVNADIDEHFAGSCEAIELEGSSEDIQVDRERGFAYLSVTDRAAGTRGEDVPQGNVLRLDLNAPVPELSTALLTRPGVFYPHGISLYIAEDGQRYLFMVNHPKNRGVEDEAVERYIETVPGSFEHVETFKNPLLARPNDLVAVGPRQVYVANDTGQDRDAPQYADLVYLDDGTVTVVADDIQSGGGINVSADGSTIYVSETNAKAIRVFGRNSNDGSLTEIRSIDLGSSPDNIDIADDGSLWIGAHSNIMALVMHFIVGSNAPTQILQVDIDGNGDASVEEIYLNRGDEITSGSVGATYGDILLIGSITAKKFLICRRDGEV
jgi:arylesterase/paraoxonase